MPDPRRPAEPRPSSAICDWLNTGPELGTVARETRRLRLIARELDTVIQLLGQRVLLEVGEDPSLSAILDEAF